MWEYATETLVLVAILVMFLYRLGTRNHDYWRARGVPGPPTVPFFGTQAGILLGRTAWPDFYRAVYDAFPGEPVVGLMLAKSPALLLRDPELIRPVLTKDFDVFPGRGIVHDEKANPLSANLAFLEGPRWRSLRVKLSPTFTTSRVRRMLPLILECGRELADALRTPAARGELVVVQDIFSRFTTDVIGSCAFGVACNSLKDPDAEFRREGMKFFETSTRQQLHFLVSAVFPGVSFLHGLVKHSSMEQLFMRVVKENLALREKSRVKRDDFLDLLLQLKNEGKIVDGAVDEVEDPFLKVHPVSTSAEDLSELLRYLFGQHNPSAL